MTNTTRIDKQIAVKNIKNNHRKLAKACSLNKALAYQNDEIVHRFITLWDISFAEAQDVFLETKKWLWLCAQPKEQRLAITSPLLIIDEMWHNFVLFSREYMQYCHDCFGCYLHHAPTTHSEKEEHKQKYADNPIGAAETRMQDQIQQFSVIARKLGVETLLKWYVEYPQRYNEEFFQQSYKPMNMTWTPSPEMQRIVSLFKAGKLVIRD